VEIITTPHDMQAWSREQQRQGRSIGFVPTMGALHRGHGVLLESSARHCVHTVLSIFVNPTQFNASADFDTYPRTAEEDLVLATSLGVSCVYMPTVETMYPEGASVSVQPGTASVPMEGAMRPGHFEGVVTVVSKLFNAVLPNYAYFGKKDYQQLAVIRQLVKDLDFPVSIVGVETVRESDGLALSSRNVRLTNENRVLSVSISTGLSKAKALHVSGEFSSHLLRDAVLNELRSTRVANVEYVSVCHPETLQPIDNSTEGAVICVAAWFGDVRLIDNIELPPISAM
jgi:pantoate--beta-alanine ligase